MFGLGYQELLIILVIVLILFGANRLPELARSLGSSVKEFKKGVNEAQKDETTSSAVQKDAVQKEEEKKA
jgi:sec-independent protein translocase protein TatA